MQAVNGWIVSYVFDGLLGAAIASKWDKSVVGQVTVTLTLEYLRTIQVERRVRGKRKAIRMLTACVCRGQGVR
jgi:acyl-coenzyme A thioesterase PaaI-like protein